MHCYLPRSPRHPDNTTFKGTVSVISIDRRPPFKDDNARNTTVPLKSKSDQKCGRYRRLYDKKVFDSNYFRSILQIL